MIDRIMRPINRVFNLYTLKKIHAQNGTALRINGRIYALGSNISFGNGVSINSGYKFNPIGGNGKTLFITYGDGKIRIGNNVGISNTAIVATQSITIEDNAMIGGSCKIYDTDFHSVQYEYRMEKPDTHIKAAPVVIKEGAFIGAHSIILKGVTIGRHSIVGAGSVVTRDVPDGEIWAGNPAVFLKKSGRVDIESGGIGV